MVKMPAKIKYILSMIAILFWVTGFAQDSQPPVPDDGFNIFLLALLSIFFCAMIGAAIIGALAASLIVFATFSLVAFGLLSASVAIGIYNKSITAGFKTLLALVFGSICGTLGLVCSYALNRLMNLELASSIVVITGATAGVTGGIVMAFATFKIIQSLIGILLKRLKLG
jgi:hypothetical protein